MKNINYNYYIYLKKTNIQNKINTLLKLYF